MSPRLLAVAFLLLFAMPANGQHGHPHPREYGVISMDHIEERDAGLGSMTLRREGPPDNRSEWLLVAHAFDTEGLPLGIVEIRYPSKGLTEIGLVTEAGDVVRFRIDEVENSTTFHHEGGDSYKIQVPKCYAQVPPVGPEVDTDAWIADCRSQQMTVTGTDKSIEQLGLDNRRFGFMTLVEIKARKIIDSEEPVKEPGEEPGGGAGFDQLLLDESSAWDLVTRCPSYSRFCGIGSGHPVVTGFAQSLRGNATGCCESASRTADILCGQQGLGLSCCSNTICRVLFPGCTNVLPCFCELEGYMWQCCQ